MTEINCSAVTGWKCDFVAKEENPDDIRQQMIDHFLSEHGEQMEKLTEKEQDKFSEKIEDLLASF